MNCRSVVTAMVVGASLLAGEAMYAAPVHVKTGVHAIFSKETLVKFNLTNATATPMTVKAGAVEMTLEPGKTVPVKLALGVQIIAVSNAPHYEAGSVIVTVSDAVKDATVTLK